MTMQKFVFLIIILFLSIHVIAQTDSGAIKGSVRDVNGKIVDGADLLLRDGSDSSVIKHAFSDTSGNFKFAGVKDGAYLISVQLIGFLKMTSPVFNITNGASSIPVISLTLQPSVKMLNSVNVVSGRPMIENRIDKTVVNVDAYITNSGNTVLDLIGTSPNVAVDQSSGTISIKGKSGAIVMIDGKQTYLGGTDLINLLNSMPSSAIDQIEIMTQPSAQYDASGNSGIINILTKKNKQAGFNLNLSLNYTEGVYPKSLNNVALNYHTTKFNLFGNISYNYNQTFTDRKWLRYFSGDSLNTLFTQTNSDKKVTSNLLASAGMDYLLNTKTTIGILATHNDSRYDDVFTSYSILQDFKNNGNVQAITDGVSTYNRPWVNNSLNLNFKTSFSVHKQLSIDLNYDSYVFNYNEQDNTINKNADGSFNNDALQQGRFPSSIKIYTAKADYARPLNKIINLETGIKSSFVKTDDDARYLQFQNNNYQVDPKLSNHFIYSENVNAVYVNFSGTLDKWSFQTGLRTEQTNNNGEQIVDDQTFVRHYLQFFPSAYLTYSPNKNSSYEISYSRRIDRPNYTDLNPFVQYIDVYTRMSGNVNLEPVFATNFELSYSYKQNLNVSAFYTSTNGVINPVYLQSDTGKIQLIILKNITQEISQGFNINYSAKLKKCWAITAFYTLF
jgi:hypothetical protein